MSVTPEDYCVPPDAVALVHGGQTLVYDLSQAVGIASNLVRSGCRAVLGIAGPPGAGKSTIGEMIVRDLGTDAVLIPMDGFHLTQAELTRQGRRGRMGAPDTFDVAGYAALLVKLQRRDDDVVFAPRFDRSIEEPIANALAIPRSVPLIITEGNYLLHDEEGWEVVAPLLDSTWYVEVPSSVREDRLIKRRIEHHDEPEHASTWVRTVDARNAETVRRTRDRADVVLKLGETCQGTSGSPCGRTFDLPVRGQFISLSAVS